MIVPADAQTVSPDPTWESWRQSLRDSPSHALRSRYSIQKAAAFLQYTKIASTRRLAVVILLYPIPALLVTVWVPLIPLQDPLSGMDSNWGFFLHLGITLLFCMFGSMVNSRAATGVTHAEYPLMKIAGIAGIGTILLMGIYVSTCSFWRFPMPFVWVVGFPPFMASIAMAHVLVLRRHILRPSAMRTRLLLYLPSLSLQTAQAVIYPLYSAAFEAASSWQQAVLVLFFPFIKYGLKRMIFSVSRHLGDFAREVSVAGVEISATMYQSMIMQNTPSRVTTALLIGLDIAIGIVDIKRFMERQSAVPIAQLMESARGTLEDPKRAFSEKDLHLFSTRRPSYWSVTKAKPTRLCCQRDAIAMSAVVPASGNRHPNDKLVVTQALEMLQSAESILLVEYLEVIVPIVNALYLLVAAQSDSALYNPKLQSFYRNNQALRAALANILLYLFLQGVSLVAMCGVMQLRYRLSAVVLLAFVLEHHAWSLQGKLIGWLPVIFAFSIVHYGSENRLAAAANMEVLTFSLYLIGMDFSLKFDFTVSPRS